MIADDKGEGGKHTFKTSFMGRTKPSVEIKQETKVRKKMKTVDIAKQPTKNKLIAKAFG